jgi:predicted transcriptional regulator
MRALLFSILILSAATANAASLEKCQSKEKNPDGIRSCIAAERSRSANRLREMDRNILDAIRKETDRKRQRALLREYRAAQAHHVRERKAACHQQAEGDERTACEADMNFAHIDQLTRFLQ